MAFPGSHHEIDLLAGSGDLVVAEGVWTGIHQGPLLTPQGAIPATGRSVAVRFVVTMRASGDLIASVHAYFDQMAFLAQLGLQPEPQPA